MIEALLASCAPSIAPSTAAALIHVESARNPHAIGVVGGRLERQPASHAEAVVTAQALEQGGWNYSVGLAQINRSNFARLGLTPVTAFEPCANLQAMQTILGECFARAVRPKQPSMPATASGGWTGAQQALRQALSCYYSGNFRTGFDHGYVDRVVRAAGVQPTAASRPIVPSTPAQGVSP